MAKLTASTITALCLPLDPDAWTEDLAANSLTDPLLSKYTEVGNRTGQTVPLTASSRLLPVLSGTQTADMDVVTLVGGLSGLDKSGAVQLGYRFRDEPDKSVRGWSPPNWVYTWTCPIFSTTVTYVAVCCTNPVTQAVAVSYWNTGGSRVVTVYDPSLHTWGAPVTVRTSGSPADVIVATPTGRYLATTGSRAYRSDDNGVTWVLHSVGLWPVGYDPANYQDARAAYGADGSVVVFATPSAALDTLVQLGSQDQLSSLTLVADITTTGRSPTVAPLPGGGFLLAYLRDAGDLLVVKRLANAWDPHDKITEIVAVNAATSECTLTVDPDGLAWLHYVPFPADGTIRVAVSSDSGQTWTTLGEGAAKSLSTADQFCTSMTSASTSGSVMLLGNWLATTASANNGSVGALLMGGWSSLPASAVAFGDARNWTDRSGHGNSSGTGDNATWFPIELPQNNGWATTGVGAHVIETIGSVRVTTTANTRYYTRTTGTSQLAATVIAELQVVSGGAVGSNEIAIRRWVSWPGNEYQIAVRFSTTQIRVRDVSGALELVTATYDTTTSFQLLVLVSTTSINAGVWVRRVGERVWTSLWAGTLVNNTATPTGTGGIEWGHLVNSTSQSRWRLIADSTSGVVGEGLGSTPAVGRPISALPIPLPGETGPAFLATTGGVGNLGEQYQIDVSRDYPVTNALPSVSPSPRAQWQAADATEQILAWDYGRATSLGDSVALVGLRCSFRTAVLEYFDVTWITAATLDLAEGFVALGASLSGDTLVPAAGTAGSRFMGEGQWAGGHVVFVTGGLVRAIRWNTAGTWSNSATGPRPRLFLEGTDGTENTAGGVTIVAPSGVVVATPGTHQIRRRWRVRVPAQGAVGGKIAAGWLVPFGVRILGSAPEWGWTREAAPNAVTSTSRSGTTRTTRVGDLVRTWTLGWSSGVDLFGLRQSADPDYVGPTTGAGAAAEDVPWLLEGLLELAQSGETPCVALASLPANNVTLTDPTLFLPGRLTASVRQDHVVGTEGEDEVVRVADLVVEGAL